MDGSYVGGRGAAKLALAEDGFAPDGAEKVDDLRMQCGLSVRD